MLVDLGRNDIHRVSITGTSEISKLMVIEKYEHVMHIVKVKGKLKRYISNDDHSKSFTNWDSIGSTKLRAIQRIYEFYPYKRGV